MPKPLVSGLMTCRNSEAYIEEALDSVLAQTYEDVEIVVSDNASTDGTPEILREYERRDPERVRVELGSEDVGPSSSRNRAFGRARGELICWLDSDDAWLPHMVSRQVEVMAARPEVGLVHGGYELIDEAGAVTERGEHARSGDLFVPLFVEGCFPVAVTTMFRRRALDDRGIGLWDRDWVYGDDYYTWLVVALDWQVAGIEEVLARYRLHESNMSMQQGNHVLKRIWLLREFLRDFPEAEARLGKWKRIGFARHYREAAALERRHGSRRRSARYWAEGMAREPSELPRRAVRALRGAAG